MILYLDTSAFVPTLIQEPTSQLCGRLWDSADRLVTTRLTHVEAAAALAMAERLGRISAEIHPEARERLAEVWPEFDVVELDDQLMVTAAAAARRHGLRGYDSVHCVAAVGIGGDDVLAASGSRRLLDAWQDEAIAIVDTNAAPEPATSVQPGETTTSDEEPSEP